MIDAQPDPVFDSALAYLKTVALTEAVKLDIFTLIGAGSTTSILLPQKRMLQPVTCGSCVITPR